MNNVLDTYILNIRNFSIAIISGFLLYLGFQFALTVTVINLESHHVSAECIGFANVMGFAGFFVSASIYSRIIHRVGLSRVLLLSTALLILTILLIPFNKNLSVIYGLEFAIAFVVAIIFLSINTIIIKTTNPQYKTTILAVFAISIAGAKMLGSSALELTGNKIVEPFIVSAICFFFIGLLFMGLDYSTLQLDSTGEQEIEEKNGVGFKIILLAMPSVILLSILVGMCKTGFNSLLPVYGLKAGLTASHAAMLVSVSFAGEMILSFPLSRWSDTVSYARALLVFSLLIICACLLVLFDGSPLSLPTWVGVFIIGGTIVAIYNLGLATISASFTNVLLTTAIASYAMSGKIGAIVGNVTIGWGMDTMGNNALFIALLIGGFLMVGSTFFFRVKD